jgi:hypothetical protein
MGREKERPGETDRLG